MRIAELSRRTGVPVPTIKYYLREGLLPSGERTSPNQALYHGSHVRRLRLIRALTEVGDLSIAETRDVLASMDSPAKTLHETLGKAHDAVSPTFERHADPASWARAAEVTAELVRRRGWQVKEGNPALDLLTRVLATLYELGQDDLVGLLDEYADAAERLADSEVKAVLGRPDLESMLEGVVIGTALGDTLIAALRRLAQTDVSAGLAPKLAKRRPPPS
jgi:DNA-binding transcriptional MerR regulator